MQTPTNVINKFPRGRKLPYFKLSTSSVLFFRAFARVTACFFFSSDFFFLASVDRQDDLQIHCWSPIRQAFCVCRPGLIPTCFRMSSAPLLPLLKWHRQNINQASPLVGWVIKPMCSKLLVCFCQHFNY